jgi:hypothetical protein
VPDDAATADAPPSRIALLASGVVAEAGPHLLDLVEGHRDDGLAVLLAPFEPGGGADRVGVERFVSVASSAHAARVSPPPIASRNAAAAALESVSRCPAVQPAHSATAVTTTPTRMIFIVRSSDRRAPVSTGDGLFHETRVADIRHDNGSDNRWQRGRTSPTTTPTPRLRRGQNVNLVV